MKIEPITPPPASRPLPGAVLTLSSTELLLLYTILGKIPFHYVTDSLKGINRYAHLSARADLNMAPAILSGTVSDIIIDLHKNIGTVLES